MKGQVALPVIPEREGNAWMNGYIRTLVVVLLAALFPVVAWGGVFPQYERVTPRYVSDSLPDSTEASKNKLTLALDYSSNSAFFGRTGGTVKFPFVSPSLTYTSKKGWWLSAGSYHLLNESSISFNQISLAAGWSFDLSDRVDGGISYSRFLFTSASPLAQSTTPHYLSSFVGYDWSYVYSTLTFSYVSGQSQDVFVSFEHSRYMSVKAGKKGTLAFEPKVSIIGGSQHFATAFVENRAKGKGNKGNGKGTSTSSSSSGAGFGLIDYEFRLPVTYTIGAMDLEMAGRYVIPVNLLGDDASTNQFIISAGAYYTF
jgi:hypothetical protein